MESGGVATGGRRRPRTFIWRRRGTTRAILSRPTTTRGIARGTRATRATKTTRSRRRRGRKLVARARAAIGAMAARSMRLRFHRRVRRGRRDDAAATFAESPRRGRASSKAPPTRTIGIAARAGRVDARGVRRAARRAGRASGASTIAPRGRVRAPRSAAPVTTRDERPLLSRLSSDAAAAVTRARDFVASDPAVRRLSLDERLAVAVDLIATYSAEESASMRLRSARPHISRGWRRLAASAETWDLGASLTKRTSPPRRTTIAAASSGGRNGGRGSAKRLRRAPPDEDAPLAAAAAARGVRATSAPNLAALGESRLG